MQQIKIQLPRDTNPSEDTAIKQNSPKGTFESHPIQFTFSNRTANNLPASRTAHHTPKVFAHHYSLFHPGIHCQTHGK